MAENIPAQKQRQRSVFLPEPSLGELEDPFRRQIMRSDSDQIQAIVSIYLIAVLAYGFIDFQLFGVTRMFALLVMTRLFLAGSSIAIIFSLRRIKSYQFADRLLFIWMMIVIFTSLFINTTRSSSFFYNSPIDLLILIGIYLAIPNIFIYRVIPALIFTAGEIALFVIFRHDLNPVGIRSIMISLLVANLLGYVTSIRLYTYRREQFKAQYEGNIAMQKIEHLARVDGLTEVFNRRFFMDLANKELQRFQRYKSPFCLLFIDMDFFKNINDTVGHQAGDSVLKQFAALARSQIRTMDLLGRMGGDEFAILLAETELANAKEIAARILLQCKEISMQGEDQTLEPTISIGVAEVQTDDKSMDDILYRADQALYQAKRDGRNKYSVMIEKSL
jgi:diguanylate cyclase (GGDEF)-like protein